VNIFLGDFIAKAGKEALFKTTVGNESGHLINSDKDYRIVKFATY
jgi:hypothetical protein